MNRIERCFVAAWPHLMVIACILLAAGCQDGSGPSLVTNPDPKANYEGAKPGPPPNPEILNVVHGGRSDKIQKMNADGSNLVVVLTRPENLNSPVWSPDGSVIAFRGETPAGGLERVQANGTGAAVLMTNSECVGGCYDPAWSPTGGEIAVLGGGINAGATGRLWIVPAGGGTPELLYMATGHPLHDVAWNSDGTRLVFTENLGSGIRVIRVIERASGTVSTELENFGYLGGVDWARGGVNTLVFDTLFDPNTMEYQIYTLDMSLPGQTPRYVSAGRNPSFSPDNLSIVLDSGGSTYKVRIAGGNSTSLARGMEPDWRR